MVMRETTSGGAQACREKALRHIERVKQTFNDSTTDEEKFQAFLKLFNSAVYGAGRCHENFQGENYHRWDNDTQTAANLHKGNQEAVIIMGLALQEMEPLTSSESNKPLSAVNGTSVAFGECCAQRLKADEAFELTDKVFHERIICRAQPATDRSIIVQKLEAVIAMIMAQFIFVPEGLLS